MNRSATILGAVLVGAALLPTASLAGPLGTVSGIAMAAVQYRQPGQVGGCSYSGGVSNGCGYINTSGFLPYNASDGQQWTSTSASLTVSLSSAVDVNGLHAQASLTVINDPLDPAALNHYWGSNPSSATAVATWNDTLMIGGPGAANMVFGFSLDGNLSAIGNGRADAKVTWFANSSSGASGSGQWTFSSLPAYGASLSTAAQLLTTGLAVLPGDTVTVQFKLVAESQVGCQALNGPMLCSASALSDLSNTLKFTSIAFRDGAGHDLSGYGISSPNFNYSGLIAAPVPEPASFLLFGLGLVGVAWQTARRRRQ